MSPASDPITRAEELLWFLLELHPPFTAAVQPGNRYKLFGSDPSSVKAKPNPQSADLPEVLIAPAGAQGEQRRNTSGKGFTQIYEIQVSTDYPGQTKGNNVAGEVQRGISPLKWEIMRALGVTMDRYPAHPHVLKIEAIPYADAPYGGTNQRGPGWEAIASVAVEMHWGNAEVGRWH
jgi:hypothetical protein